MNPLPIPPSLPSASVRDLEFELIAAKSCAQGWCSGRVLLPTVVERGLPVLWSLSSCAQLTHTAMSAVGVLVGAGAPVFQGESRKLGSFPSSVLYSLGFTGEHLCCRDLRQCAAPGPRGWPGLGCVADPTHHGRRPSRDKGGCRFITAWCALVFGRMQGCPWATGFVA